MNFASFFADSAERRLDIMKDAFAIYAVDLHQNYFAGLKYGRVGRPLIQRLMHRLNKFKQLKPRLRRPMSRRPQLADS
jgi:hypothetical protein